MIEILHGSRIKHSFKSGINNEDFWTQKAISLPKLQSLSNFIFIDVSMRAGVFGAFDYYKLAPKSVR